MTWPVQELKAFLTVEGSLADSYQWRQLQPLQGSVLEGIARLPKQLLGAPSRPAHRLHRLSTPCSSTLAQLCPTAGHRWAPKRLLAAVLVPHACHAGAHVLQSSYLALRVQAG